MLVSEGWKHDPFPGLEKAFNAVTITHPSPNALWNPSAPVTLTRPEWEAEDGGERVFDLKLPMVFNTPQARQIGNALLKENRRFRTHRLPLPPEYSNLRPLLKTRFTSDWYGYNGKTFTITEMAFDLLKLNVSVSLREWDHSDFDPDLALEIPDVPQVTAPIVTQDAGVPGFGVSGIEIKDANGIVRGVGIRAVWNPSLAATADGVSFQVRVKDGDDERFSASTADLELGTFRLEPVQGGTEYEARAKAISKTRDTKWTGWFPVTTPVFRLQPDVLAEEITADIANAQAAADAAAADASQALLDADWAQSQLDSLAAGFSGVSLQQSLDDLLASTTADIDSSEMRLRAQMVGGNLLATNSGTNGLGEWINATVSSDVPASAPAGAKSLEISDVGREGIYRLGSPIGKHFRVRGWVKVISPAGDDIRFIVRGSGGEFFSTDDGARVSQSDAPDWAYIDKIFEVTAGSAGDWAPAVDIVENGSGDLVRVYDLLWEEVTGTAEVYAELQDNYYSAADADLAIAAREMHLQSQIDTTSADLATNYYAKSDVDGAVALAEQNLRVEIENTETDVQNLSGEITDVQAVDVGALAGTALGALLQQLEVDAGGTSAKILNQGSAIADLEGNASAGYLIKAQAGGEVSLLQLVAADGSSGQASVAKISAKDILLDGTVYASKLAVSSFDNLNPDFHFEDTDLWSGADSFYGTSFEGWGSSRVMRIKGPGNTYEFVPGPVFNVSPEGEQIRGAARGERYSGTNDGGDDMALQLQLSNVEDFSSGVAAAWASPPLTWKTTTVTKKEGVFTIPPGYRFARIRPYIRPTGATEVRLAGIELRRMNAGELMVDGGVTADHMATDSITAANGAIKDLAVERLKLAVGAVTELVRLSKTDSTSVAYNAGSRTSSTSDLNTYYAASGTANMHKVSSATLTYTVPSSNPPEKLLIQPTVRMGMTFWDWNTGGNRAYNLVAGIKVLVDGSEALGWMVPGNNYSFYRTPQMSVPLMYHRPDVLLELGADYSAGDAVKFEVFIFRGDASGHFQFGFNMREHTVDILEFYK